MADSRYPAPLRRLHWLVFLLVVGALVLIFLHGAAEKGSVLRANLKWAHTQFGIAILLVMLPRIALRISRRGAVPPISPALPRWQAVVADAYHALLYGLLVVTPLFGIATMWLKGKPWNILGIPLPFVAVSDAAFADRIEGMHQNLGLVVMYLAGLHAVIALYHHFVRRDDALERLLPPRE